MRKLLNVLYVTTPDSYLSLDGENIVINLEGKEMFRIPIHNLESIICFGYKGVSPSLMGFCMKQRVGMCFLTPNGRFLARVSGGYYGNVLLRKEQYRVSDDENKCVLIASNCITAKLINTKVVIERGLRDHENKVNTKALNRAIAVIKNNAMMIQNCKTLDELRGLEGICSKEYFDIFDELILAQKEYFFLNNRYKRPPTDNVNALLSFLYTVLAHDVQSALETVGLDPYVGFLHKDRPGRPSLALDLMEEFRAFLVDRLVLSLINRKQVTHKGFILKESGVILMDDKTKKDVLIAWQKRKQDTITHPFIKEKVFIGLLPYIQAQLLARYLRGDIESYPPFFWK